MGNRILVLKDPTVQWGLQMSCQVMTADLCCNGGMCGVLRILEAQGEEAINPWWSSGRPRTGDDLKQNPEKG